MLEIDNKLVNNIMAKKDWMIIESELDEDQIKVLMATLDKSCVVSGCAGSGKSVLALIKAQRIQKEKGDDYQVIVFTKSLSRYMNSGREILGLKKEFSYYWNWVNRQGMPSSKYLIVDEIQDFSQEEIEDFIKATNNNFYFFGDTAQAIYGGLKQTIPVDEIPSMLEREKKPKVFELYRNYRLPVPVARVAQYIGIGLDAYEESTYKSKEIELPRILRYESKDEQIESIAEIIKSKELNDVAILLSHNDDVDTFFEELSKHKINCERKSKTEDTLNFNSRNVKIMTYHSAKGLQFECVFLPWLIDIYDDDRMKALYVALTRTYRYLYMMYNNATPKYIDAIPQELYKKEIIDTVEDI